jgi:hypothetical protein
MDVDDDPSLRLRLRQPRESGWQQLIEWARAELLAARMAASGEQERARMGRHYERLFGPLSQSPGDGG